MSLYGREAVGQKCDEGELHGYLLTRTAQVALMRLKKSCPSGNPRSIYIIFEVTLPRDRPFRGTDRQASPLAPVRVRPRKAPVS